MSKCQILSDPESNLSDHLPLVTEIKVNVSLTGMVKHQPTISEKFECFKVPNWDDSAKVSLYTDTLYQKLQDIPLLTVPDTGSVCASDLESLEDSVNCYLTAISRAHA